MVKRRALWLLPVVAVATGVACKPTLEGRPSFIEGPRVLAVRSEPAELEPDDATTVRYTSLYVGPAGALDDTSLDLALCNTRKPIAVAGPIALECLAASGPSLDPITGGEVALEANACRIFGPTPPEPKPGEPASRAADPDTTGGYYQPVRVMFDVGRETEFAVGVTRLSCGLPGASQEQSLDYANRYRPNENPALSALTLRSDSGHVETFPDDPSAPALQVAAGEHVTLGAAWVDCPVKPSCGDGICGAGEATSCPSGAECTVCTEDCTTPRGCQGSEPYVMLDPATREIIDRREAMRVSWFSTGGYFDHDRTGRGEDEASVPSTENGWTAPSTSGLARLWVVLRDDRGGVGWGEFHVDVQP